MVGGSTIAIAHRLVSIRGADMIVVLEEGEVVEIGTHDEFLRVDGAYANLIRLQRYGKTSTKASSEDSCFGSASRQRTGPENYSPLSPRSVAKSSAAFSRGKNAL